MTTHSTPETPESLREQARQCRQRSVESFERCDTDGFLSQWASDMTATLYDRKADLLERGNIAEFPALFDLDGNWIPAQRFDGRYGPRWMVLDADGRRTGEYLPYRPARRATLAKHGYVEGRVIRPAFADIRDSRGGWGCSVQTLPATKPWEPPLEIVCTDRWAD